MMLVEMNAPVIEDSPFQLSDAPSEPELVAKYFRGLGDPTRLRVLELLAEHGELSAGEIVERVQLPQATVSTHLGCLRWCGFVVTRREHRSVLYRIADERVSAMVALAQQLLRDKAEHVAACCTIDAKAS
jgi:DNA-binding transcriptional ArsR family regulator